MSTEDKTNSRYLENWQDERNSAALYQALAEIEKNPQLKEIYRRMGQAEEKHSIFWEAKLRASNQTVPARHTLSWRTRVLILLAKSFGPKFVLPTISTMEQMDSHSYDIQTDARLEKLPQQEQSHARLLKAITGGSRGKGLEGSQVARLEGRHRATGGNALRAAVLGANDGLVSNLSLVMGVAGADMVAKTVLVTGLAGLIAGACSMAMGEWLSVQSARELYLRQIAVEKQEIAEVPDEEAEELSLIYQSKGLPEEEATNLANRLIHNQSNALDTLSREELGIDPAELGGSPWSAALTSFGLFALGAIVPVISFFFMQGFGAVLTSLLLSSLALFLIGAAITLLTGRNVLFSGFRQVLFGLLAAGITFGIGRLIGAAITG